MKHILNSKFRKMLRSANRLFVLSFLCAYCICTGAQNSGHDADMILIAQKLNQNQQNHNHRSWVYKNDTTFFRKVNPAALLYGGSIYVYQNVFSKHLSTDCLYSPSCSDFSKQIVRQEGLIKGILLSVDRVNRCNRIVAAGMKNRERDRKTGRFTDPVSTYTK